MSLARLVESAIAGLVVDPSITVTDRLPLQATDVPAIVLSVTDAERPNVGVGGIPSSARRGSLPVTASVDLADSELDFGDDTIDLIDTDRTTLIVPNGPIVTASGAEGPPFDAGDVTIVGPGGPWAITDDPPVGRAARVDPALGTITFGEPLPANGILAVGYHVGMWEETISRYSGLLHVDMVSGAGAAATDLAAQVGEAFERLERDEDAFHQLVPVAWGSATPVDHLDGDHLVRRSTYRFVYERRLPNLATGGGIIRTIEVTVDTDGETEDFELPLPT